VGKGFKALISPLGRLLKKTFVKSLDRVG